MKQAAIAAMHKLPEIPTATAKDILKELSVFDWNGDPIYGVVSLRK